MKSKLLKERGQALILIAFGAIALFAIAGLAIDGSHKYSDRRHAQNAADTSALAGALAMARGVPQWELDALDRAQENGYDNVFPSNTVEVHNPPVSGYYNDCSDVHYDCHDYVQVIITSTKQTWFMRVLGINEFTNVVQAVASKRSQNNSFNFGGNAVVALAPDDNLKDCALTSQGNTALTVNGGGLYSNSDSQDCAFQKNSCAGVTDINVSATPGAPSGTITTVGGMSINTGCPPDAILQPGGAKQIPFPPPWQELPPPLECSQPGVVPTGKTVTLSPGYYAKMPPKTNITSTTLKPGIYCIGTTMKVGAGEVFQVQAGAPGVLLYFMPGGEFDTAGGAIVNIWGINQANIDIDSRYQPYKGFLIYAAPNYASGTPVGCFLNGNSDSSYVGTIYAPYCNITMNGASDEVGFQSQVIGYTVSFSGRSHITLTYDASSSPVWNIPLQVGLDK